MGEDYDTSAHRHIIHKLQMDINGAGTSNGFWRAGVFAIDSSGDITAVLGRSGTEGIDVDQRHTFVLPDPIEIPASQRIRIYGSRVDSDGESGSGTRSAHLSRGDEDSASPRKSYDDANLDFARIRHVRANTAFPEVGDTTHDHDAASVRGDIKIWFTTKIDHGQIVGDGTVNAAHINSGTSADGEVLTSDGSGGASWEASSGGGGGGAITQATEATLGGVRGATALQAIASSGTTILGWTNNRLRQFIAAALPPATAAQAIAAAGTDRLTWTVTRLRELVTAALPTMTQTDIDNATTDRKAVTGELIAANAGGGGGGGTAPDRIVLADAVGVSNTAGPHEIALTEAMAARQILTFFVGTSGATNPDAIGYLLSDDVLALTAEATAPTDSENGLPL